MTLVVQCVGHHYYGTWQHIQTIIDRQIMKKTVQRTGPQGSSRTPATCIAATTPGLIVRILNFVLLRDNDLLRLKHVGVL